MSTNNDIDNVMSLIGWGWWQVPIIILSLLGHFTCTIHVVGSTLLSAPVPFRCVSAHNASMEATSSTNTNSTHTPDATVFDSHCSPQLQPFAFPHALRVTDLLSCPFVEYDQSTFQSSIISEYNLVCERATMRPLFQMIFSFGLLFGAPLAGAIADRYGRKTAVLVGSVMNAAAVVVMTFSPQFVIVLCTRFVTGLTTPFLIQCSFSLVQETTPPKFRTLTGMLVGLGFSLGLMAVAGQAFLLRQWRHLFPTASCAVILLIPIAWVVEESPRWLAQKGRHKEAVDALTRAARRNQVSITPEFIAAIEKVKTEKMIHNGAEHHEEGEGLGVSLTHLKHSFSRGWDYLKYPSLLRILLISPLIWYLQNIVYMGIILNANNFTSNDPFVYITLSAIMDGSAILLATPLCMRFGRRVLMRTFYVILAALLYIDLAITPGLWWLKYAMVMTAFLLGAACYQIMFVYTLELYPTSIRSRGFGLGSAAGSLGFITTPLLTDLLAQHLWWAVNVACASTGMLSAVLVSFLPETRNLPLAETVQDLERRRLRKTEGKEPAGVAGGLPLSHQNSHRETTSSQRGDTEAFNGTPHIDPKYDSDKGHEI